MANALAGSSVVVTGGAGFIGSHLVRRLVELGVARVVVVDSLRYGDQANLAGMSDRVELVQHTLGSDSPDALREPLDAADYLFHLAAEKHNQSKDDPVRVLRANVEGTLTLFEAACKRGVQKILFTSSLYAYGRMQGSPFVETELPRPSTIYGISKLTGEHLLAYCARTFGVRTVALRYLFVYGPRQFAGMGYKSVIVKNFERLLAGQPPTVYGDGEQALDYVYVDDVVEATILAMTSETTGEVFNVGSGEATSVNHLIDTMIGVSGTEQQKQYGPPDWTAGSCRVGDASKIAKSLGWRPRTSLREGLEQTWSWMRESS